MTASTKHGCVAAVAGVFLSSIGCESSAGAGYIAVMNVEALSGAQFPALTAADLDGDGDVDLAASGVGVTVLVGNGDGTFRSGASYDGDFVPDFVLASDFNGDGNADLMTAAGFAGIHVLLGQGAGAFGSPMMVDAGNSVVSPTLAAGDFDRNGTTDVAVASAYNFQLAVLSGNGDGTFQTPSEVVVPQRAGMAVVAADFNGDDKLDLAVRQDATDGVVVLLGQGDGTFPSQKDAPVSDHATAVFAVGDLNGDGLLDAAVAADFLDDTGVNVVCQLGALLGNGDGTFQAGGVVMLDSWGCRNLVAGDFNGDGKLDLAVVSDKTTILLGNGDGTFGRPIVNANVGGIDPHIAVAADFDGDGRSDLAFASGWDVRIILGRTVQ